MPPFAAITVCVSAVFALLLAEKSGRRRLKWVAKTTASLGFVALAVANGAFESVYGQWVLAGLVLCLIGDVLLIPKSETFFLAGMAAFAAGHGAYLYAFVSAGAPNWLHFAAAIAVSLAAVLPVLRWLWPHLNDFQRPVSAYCIIIGAMVAASLFAAPAFSQRWVLIVGGAIAFAVSDIAVARDQFVKPAFTNRLWGLPLYYGAQLMLASSV